MIRPVPLVIVTLLALAGAAPSAHAVAAGTGVAGTLDVSWSNTTGTPVTAWAGQARLAFDPSLAARRATLAAIADPALGEPTRPVSSTQLQAARATALSSSKTETVTCMDEDGNTYQVPWNSSAGPIADGRIAFEILPPQVDLISGRGTISLGPYLAPAASGWYVADRFALPGRLNQIDDPWPCPGDGGQPAERLPRIVALNGGAAVPRAITDWLHDSSRSLDWPVRRTASGWKVLINTTRRDTFSDSVFGPQDTQQLDMTVRSDLRIVGSWRALQARCKVPFGLIARARSSAAAVRIARRAGLNARFAGTRRVSGPRRIRHGITGRIGMGYGYCHRGSYGIWRYARS